MKNSLHVLTVSCDRSTFWCGPAVLRARAGAAGTAITTTGNRRAAAADTEPKAASTFQALFRLS